MSEDSTKAAFREAFTDALATQSGESYLSHEDLVDARGKVFLLAQDAFKEVFPKVLYDALETHVSDPITDLDLDAFHIISCLNVVGRTPDYELERSEFGEAAAHKSIQGDESLLRAKTRMFERFTRQQAQAICDWLERAKTWTGFQLYLQDIDEAYQYWNERAGQPPSKSGSNPA